MEDNLTTSILLTAKETRTINGVKMMAHSHYLHVSVPWALDHSLRYSFLFSVASDSSLALLRASRTNTLFSGLQKYFYSISCYSRHKVELPCIMSGRCNQPRYSL